MSKKDPKQTALQLLKAFGGKENIKTVLHCATRLRVTVMDDAKVNVDAIKQADHVAGYYLKSGQHQVILGTGFVNKVFDVFAAEAGKKEMEAQDDAGIHSFKDLTKFISDIFIPIIPVLLATGIIMGLQGLMTSLGISLSVEANTILSVLTGTAYTFIPVLVCWSAMKKMGGSPVLGLVLGLMLVSPSLPDKWSVVNGAAEALHFDLGFTTLSITGYQSSVIPALCLGILAALLERKLNKVIPDIVQLLLVPFLTLAISLLAGLFVIGPVLLVVEQTLTAIILSALNLPFGIGGIAYAGGIQLLCVVGMHHTITPVIVSLYTATGLDYINPLGSAAIAGQLGAGIALVMMERNRNQRVKMVPALIPALFGISEPVMYGLTFPKVKPFLFGCVGAGIAGCFASIMGLAAKGTGASMLPGALLYLQGGLTLYLVVLAIAVLVSMALTFLFAKEKESGENNEKASANDGENSVQVMSKPAAGEILPISESSDPTFAEGTLGDGIVIRPENGKVVAPCDGTISFVYPSGHALGIELKDGTNILIHCGIDTVNLNGEGFQVKIKEGDSIKTGDFLLEFDKALIEEKGYSTEIMMVVSDLPDGRKLRKDDLEEFGNHVVLVIE